MEIRCSTSDSVEDHIQNNPFSVPSSDEISLPASSERSNSVSKIGKKKSPRWNGQSPMATKLSSQIKKPIHRKSPPLNWFPRKKMASYLQRKIRMLQEVDGMNSSLDETLGDSNPHYSKVLREKIAATEAANKAMEARKAAMVEASWCRILKAARIHSQEAEAALVEAEKIASEAFERASALGVIIYDKKTCHKKNIRAGDSPQHTVTALFATAFEVDKEVAAALKRAIVKLANSSSFEREEFKDLVRKLILNPTNEPPDVGTDDEQEANYSILKEEPNKSEKNFLVNTMVGRLETLKEEELSSLATIVASCGLSAALAEEESLHNSLEFASSAAAEAKGARNPKWADGSMENDEERSESENNVADLGSVLVKHSSRLEKEIELAKKNANVNYGSRCKKQEKKLEEMPDLGSILVKHSSRLEKEVEEARSKAARKSDFESETTGKELYCKRKIDTQEQPGLDKCLVKHASKLEKEVQEARSRRKIEEPKAAKLAGKENIDGNQKEKKKLTNEEEKSAECGRLDQILVKSVSRLEKEKIQAREEEKKAKVSEKSNCVEDSNGGLEQILVKHKSKLEREKENQKQERDVGRRRGLSRREEREREMQEEWGGMGLGSFIKPHLSKLEREKAAWIKAEEEERSRGLN